MVLAQNLTHRSMEQHRKPRNKPRTYGQLICDKGGNFISWEKTVSLIHSGKTGHVKE